MGETRERWRGNLPHWEVQGRPHFVTLRCVGSLPEEACRRLREVNSALQATEPHSPQFLQLQRQYFVTAEKYLDRGDGFAPFLAAIACDTVVACLQEMKVTAGWTPEHFVVMPNHVHLLLRAEHADDTSLRSVLGAFKGRSSRLVNLQLNRRGDFWQSEWFDRWARDDTEEQRMISYIRQNPVKAGMVKTWEDYRWVQ